MRHSDYPLVLRSQVCPLCAGYKSAMFLLCRRCGERSAHTGLTGIEQQRIADIERDVAAMQEHEAIVYDFRTGRVLTEHS